MEMCDPSVAGSAAPENTLNQTSDNDVIMNEDLTVTDKTNGLSVDPEAAAEEEMTEALDEELETEETNNAESLLSRVKALSEKDPAEISGDELRHLRQMYVTLHKNEIESARRQWLEQGNDAESFVEPINETDDRIKNLLESVRNRKAEYVAAQEIQKVQNLARKNEIIEEIISLAEDTDNVNRTFARYRELQDEFNSIGDVVPTEETSVWKRFQDARERYSDNLKINKELRDYDFKKNYDSKQLLLNEAEGLITEEDVITAYRRLQELHNKWRQIGPVAKEIREDIWDKFKNASAEINKRYQAHFEARKAREAENEAGKIAICERLEALDFSDLKTFNAWDAMTKIIIEAQTEWKKLGFASRKMNNQLFARFRGICDKFFTAKADFFANTRDEHAKNLAAKTALAERAEALKDSTDWRKATEEFVAMQKEWKTIGTVGKKNSDAVWKRFLTACDYFFDQKKKATSGVKQSENANLKAKQEIISKLSEIDLQQPAENTVALLRDLQNQWQQTGHVPFKEKDKIYDEYRRKVNEIRDALNLKDSNERLNKFETSVDELEGDTNKLYRERERLLRSAEAKRNELRTYENNLGFISAKTKTGDSMFREFQRKIDRIKSDLEMINKKVKLIDSKL